jgi:hypothetical protein
MSLGLSRQHPLLRDPLRRRNSPIPGGSSAHAGLLKFSEPATDHRTSLLVAVGWATEVGWPAQYFSTVGAPVSTVYDAI